jgi:hypothetical protein
VTGQSLYDQWALSGYNVGFTAVPILALAIFDKDVEPEIVLSKDLFPELYHDGMKNLIFNTMSFWMYTSNAIVHSLTCFFICLFTTDAFATPEGQGLGLVGTGITCYTSVLFVVTAKICLEAHLWTLPNLAVNVGSLGMWFFFLGVYGTMFKTSKIESFAPWYGLPVLAMGTWTFWFTTFLCLTICIMREVAWKCWRHNFSQKLVHVVQELRQKGKKFSRRDVLRWSPHLLPKFDALKPYDPAGAGGTGGGGETEMSLAALVGIGSTSPRRRMAAGNQQDTRRRGDANDSKSNNRQPTGAFFAKRGAVNIRSVVLDDDEL